LQNEAQWCLITIMTGIHTFFIRHKIVFLFTNFVHPLRQTLYNSEI
jgi:hypothetical protein